MTTALSHPAVILEHSGYIKSVQCSGSNLDISFTEKTAFDFAGKAWATERDFILSTYTDGCGTPKEQHTFWLIDHFETGSCDNCITAVVRYEIPTEDALHEVDVIWGQYTPDRSSHKGYGSNLRQRQDTSNRANSRDCGKAPSSKIDGFPTAACNSPTFDEDLDYAIGYFDFEEEKYSQSLQEFVPGLKDVSPENNEGFEPILDGETGLVRRQGGRWFGNFVAAAVKRTLKAASLNLKAVSNYVAQGASAVGQKVVNAIAVSPRFNLTVPAGVPLPDSLYSDSPWGKALKIYTRENSTENTATIKGGTLKGESTATLTVYCVGCGVRGAVRLNGRAKWALKDGLQSAVVQINGTLGAGFSLGLDSVIATEQVFDYPLGTVGVPGWQIYGVIIVGPSFGLSAVAELNIALAGQVLAGVNVTIPNFNATLDYVDGSNSTALNFVPEFDPVFNATAEITARFALGLALTFGVGLEIPAIKFKRTASVSNVPSIAASANYTASTTDEGVDGNEDCVNGIGYKIELLYNVFADLFGLAKYPLVSASYPLIEGCNLIGGNSTNSTANATATADAIDTEDDSESFDYLDTLSTDDTDNTLYDPVNESSLDVLAAEEKKPNNSQLVFPPETEFDIISDLSSNDELFAEANGNIYYASPNNGTIFASVSSLIEGDGAGRFLHYYPDVMSAYNVSRLRLSDEAYIPITAEFIALAPVNYDEDSNSPDIYVATDTAGGVFFPVTCDIQDQDSKAFIVADIEEGVETLRDPKLRYTVTGGIVEECYFLPWAAPPGSSNM
ncbi:MAG: hypothetical protein LQ352_003067 [Teloschistes flavicans]|nr:MAG: hypothetical protein LQ352_003067 [Teloschistes flavicans]